MTDEKLPMGKVISCHLGTFTFYYEVLEIEIHDNHLIATCKEGKYKAYKDDAGGNVIEELEFWG